MATKVQIAELFYTIGANLKPLKDAFNVAVAKLKNMGAKIVFADIDRGTLNVDPGSIENAITDRTKAIIAVLLPFAVLAGLWIVLALLIGFTSLGVFMLGS